MFGRAIIMVVVVIGSFLATLPSATALAQETEWGCYDPKPGHPTPDERQAFLKQMRPIASKVQAEFGIPRAGILAMSVQESGYGWTRTAIHAKNLFGWKFGQSARAARLKSWTLECQPPSDPGKLYAVFPSFEESMKFVARALSQQRRYSEATLAARRAIEAGKPEQELTETWLRAIQKAGYNPNPDYPDHVLQAGRRAGVFSGWD